MGELRPDPLGVESAKLLARGDEVHTGVAERRGLRRPGDAREKGTSSQPALSCLSYTPLGSTLRTRLPFSRNSSLRIGPSRSLARDDAGAREPAFCLEQIQDATRVRGAILTEFSTLPVKRCVGSVMLEIYVARVARLFS